MENTKQVEWETAAALLLSLRPDLVNPAQDEDGAYDYRPYMRPKYPAEREKWQDAITALADFFALRDGKTFDRRAFELMCGYNSATS